MAKKKTTAKRTDVNNPSQDSLRFVLLVWILTFFLLPASLLIRNFFGGEALSDEYYPNMQKTLLWGNFFVLLVSFVVSLALSKDSSEKPNSKAVARRAFIIATVFNVIVFLLLILDDSRTVLS